MKQNKGITLIALVITIIVLLILAGITIAMLSGDNGILNRANESKYDNIISSVDEQAKLAQLGVRTSITANMSNEGGYIATISGKFDALVNEVAAQLGVATTAVGTHNNEGYSVYKYLDAGSTSVNGTGYILITYTDNALRSSLPASLTPADNTTWTGVAGMTHKVAIDNSDAFTRNKAVIAYVIKVSNYKSELSNGILTVTTTEASAASASNATAFDGTKIGTQDGFTVNPTS